MVVRAPIKRFFCRSSKWGNAKQNPALENRCRRSLNQNRQFRVRDCAEQMVKLFPCDDRLSSSVAVFLAKSRYGTRGTVCSNGNLIVTFLWQQLYNEGMCGFRERGHYHSVYGCVYSGQSIGTWRKRGQVSAPSRFRVEFGESTSSGHPHPAPAITAQEAGFRPLGSPGRHGGAGAASWLPGAPVRPR